MNAYSRKVGGELNGLTWKMGGMEDTNSTDEHFFSGRNFYPVWQMVKDEECDGDDEYLSENDICLTGNVRACYLNYLEKILIKNYEMCNDKDRSEWRFSREDLLKCAAWIEQKALRSCMVVILYQRAMKRLTADIKKYTDQLKLYRKLKDFLSFDSGCCTKTTQTGENLNFIDRETQTDSTEMNVTDNTNGAAFQSNNSYQFSGLDVSNQSLSESILPLNIKTEAPDSENERDEPTQGVPIPVYVSGISPSVPKVRNTHHPRVIKNIEPVPFNEVNKSQEEIPLTNGVQNTEFDETCQSLLRDLTEDNGFENPLDTTIEYNDSDAQMLLENIKVEEPYEWSVIEKRTDVTPSPNKKLCVRHLSDEQQNETISNGISCEGSQNDTEFDDMHHMSLDERLMIVLGIKNPDEPEETPMEVKKEPSKWYIERCQQEEMLHNIILETCVDMRKRGRLRLRFIELFGSDCEENFDIEDQVSVYKDKIARWVVESLMPYYREGRILSRPIFKFLARHIADRLLVRKKWQSESDVMQSVVEFFSHRGKIQSEADVLS